MKILIVHNKYQQSGGEDAVFAAETALLRGNGHTVIEYLDDNQRIPKIWNASLAVQVVWSRGSYKKILQIIKDEQPEIAHFHNTFPLISPSAYYACRKENIPVVQSLHNYRLVCPNALFFRDNHPCEDCLGKTIPWPGVWHCCYHHSSSQSAAVASMIAIHRLIGTWHSRVDTYIALTEFARRKFIQGGLPAEKIVIKSNFVDPDPGPKARQGDFAIFVGRLSPEKGIDTLMEAWKRRGIVPIKVIGDGPMRQFLEHAAKTNNLVDYLGRLSHHELFTVLKNSRFLIFPSVCYEGLPNIILEAFATGSPVVAANLGAASEIVQNKITGIHFRFGDPSDLIEKVNWAWEHPDEMAEMGKNARLEYEEKYTADKNYQVLTDVYQRTIETHRARAG
jgi:glycosyltransferase involved in cell wall biosynthesis